MRRRRPRYHTLVDGRFYRQALTACTYIGCCDCGLVHRVAFRLTTSGRLYVGQLRDDGETARVRRRFPRRFVCRPARPVRKDR